MYTKIPEIITSTKFRATLSVSFKKAKEKPLAISTEKGKEQYVLLNSKMYNDLVSLYENMIDTKELIKQVAEEDKKKGRILLGRVRK